MGTVSAKNWRETGDRPALRAPAGHGLPDGVVSEMVLSALITAMRTSNHPLARLVSGPLVTFALLVGACSAQPPGVGTIPDEPGSGNAPATGGTSSKGSGGTSGSDGTGIDVKPG